MMKYSQRMQVFNDRYPLIGPTFWVASLQYFVTQIVAANYWAGHYSWLRNAISDLGNTACGQYSGRYVCSPLHAWMDASFVVLGATMVAGASLIYQEFRETRGSALGFGFMALAGAGTIVVGLFPENTVSFLHFAGALLPFLIGNIGIVVLGSVLGLPKALRAYSVISGAIALIALALFYSHNYLGLGFGGMERLVAYPQTVWLIVFGLYMSRNHASRQSRPGRSASLNR